MDEEGQGGVHASGLRGTQADTRRSEWVAARNQRLRVTRSKRISRLKTAESSRGDVMAQRAWADLGVTTEALLIRAGYVVKQGTKRSQSPLGLLAANAGRSTHLHLAMLGVANATAGGRAVAGKVLKTPRPAPGGLPIVVSDPQRADWAKLLGIPAAGKARTVRVHEPLRSLRALGFIEYPQGRPSDFVLRGEDLSSGTWVSPSADPIDQGFAVPTDFWRQRWYLWLTPSEIAAYLSLLHSWRQLGHVAGSQGVGLPESRRRDVYGMSDERYSTLHEIVEFGLADLVAPSVRPTRGGKRNGLTHHFKPTPEGLARPARETIAKRLAASELPPRLDAIPLLRLFSEVNP